MSELNRIASQPGMRKYLRDNGIKVKRPRINQGAKPVSRAAKPKKRKGQCSTWNNLVAERKELSNKRWDSSINSVVSPNYGEGMVITQYAKSYQHTQKNVTGVERCSIYNVRGKVGTDISIAQLYSGKNGRRSSIKQKSR